MKKYKHSWSDNISSLLIGFGLIAIIYTGWKLATYSIGLFFGSMALVLGAMTYYSLYEFVSGTRKSLDLSGFIAQSAPIAASSFIAGWTAYRIFKIDEYNQNFLADLEGNVILLLISVLLAFFSMIALVESAYPDKYKVKSAAPAGFYSGRWSLMLNLLSVHGLLSGITGLLLSIWFN